jgi:sucrose-6-phosphate hydrolase SacC (GH32 family)
MEENKLSPLYDETYRPQFHFSAATNWINDPNGLVYYRGEYHLFFQHNPLGNEWGNMTWGHAVSRDLLHWTQLPHAIEPDEMGTIFSGSAVVDYENTSRLRRGKEKPLVALYTAAGGSSPASQGQPYTQCLAYSTDRGRTWFKHADNPVLKHISASNRDPKVVWHPPTRRWIMALYLDGNDYTLLSSPDLKEWTRLHDLHMPECSECPDFFEMPVVDGPNTKHQGSQITSGTSDARKWIFTAANGHYFVGNFDGETFTPEAGPLQADYGANFYAVQTYSDIPPADGRRIQIAWMNGGSYPQMPFNQQMSFPCAITLRQTDEGLRLYRWPVNEIRTLYTSERKWRNAPIRPGINLLAGLSGDLWDIEAEFEVGAAPEFGIRARGQEIRYTMQNQTVTCLGRSAPLTPEENTIRLRVLVDRASLEVFGNGGRVSLTSCFLPEEHERGLEIYTVGSTTKLLSLKVRQLRSVWNGATTHKKLQ